MATLLAIHNANPKLRPKVVTGLTVFCINRIIRDAENVITDIILKDSEGDFSTPDINEDVYELYRGTYPDQIETAVAEVDAKTEGNINGGFAFGGNNFSLSVAAQSNWTALVAMQNAGLIVDPDDFPYEVSTKGSGTASLASPTELLQFAGTAAGTVNFHLHAGRVIRDALNAIDVNAVDAQALIDAQVAANNAR